MNTLRLQGIALSQVIVRDAANLVHEAVMAWGPSECEYLALRAVGETITAVVDCETEADELRVQACAARLIHSGLMLGLTHGPGETYSYEAFVTVLAHETAELARRLRHRTSTPMPAATHGGTGATDGAPMDGRR